MKQLPLLAAALLLPGIACAEGVGLTAKIGTLGLGAELTGRLSDSWNARVGFNNYSYHTTRSENDVDYDAKLQLRTFTALADWHPFDGGFRTSLGLVANQNKFDMVGKPSGTGTYDLNGTPYNASDIGSLKGKLTFNSTAPYLGIGWGNAVAKDTNWNFSFDLGVLFQGKPKFALTTDSAYCRANTANCQDNLNAEQAKTESDMKNYRWYPVISFGASYQF